MHIRKAQSTDGRQIAALHRREIPWGLLSDLGPEFVARFYEALISSELGLVIVAEDDGRLVGFAGAVAHWRRFYRHFLWRHFWLAVRVLAASVRWSRWRRLFETSRYTASSALPPAELVSIAVEPDVRGAGVAGELVRQILDEFAARGVQAVRVTTDPSNVRANRLYEKMGFGLHTVMEIHSGEADAIYVIALRPAAQHRTNPV